MADPTSWTMSSSIGVDAEPEIGTDDHDNERASGSEVFLYTPSKRLTRSSHSKLQNGLNAKNPQPHSATLSRSPSPKRRRVTRSTVHSREIDYDTRFHPLDAVLRPNARTTLARQAKKHEGAEDDKHMTTNKVYSPSLSNSRYETRSKGEPIARLVSTAHALTTPALARSETTSGTAFDSSARAVSDPTTKKRRATRSIVSHKHPINPFVEAVSTEWSSMSKFDRYLYLMQKGVPIGGTAIPLKWSEVIDVLAKEGHFTIKKLSNLSIERQLKTRYEQVRRAVQGKFADREPKDMNGWRIYRVEDFDVYDYTGSSTIYVHKGDQTFKLDSKGFLRDQLPQNPNNKPWILSSGHSTLAEAVRIHEETRSLDFGSTVDPLPTTVAQAAELLTRSVTQDQAITSEDKDLSMHDASLAADEDAGQSVPTDIILTSSDTSSDNVPQAAPVQPDDLMIQRDGPQKYMFTTGTNLHNASKDLQASASAAITKFFKQAPIFPDERQVVDKDDSILATVQKMIEDPLSDFLAAMEQPDRVASSSTRHDHPNDSESDHPIHNERKTYEAVDRKSMELAYNAGSEILADAGARRPSTRKRAAAVSIHEDQPGTTPKPTRFLPLNVMGPELLKENQEAGSEVETSEGESSRSPGSTSMYGQSTPSRARIVNGSPTRLSASSPRLPTIRMTPRSRSRLISSHSPMLRRSIFGPFTYHEVTGVVPTHSGAGAVRSSDDFFDPGHSKGCRGTSSEGLSDPVVDRPIAVAGSAMISDPNKESHLVE